jgi:uracil-DNA glycosylase family 4
MDIPSTVQKWVQLNNEIMNCRLCPRLVTWREEMAVKKRRAYQNWDYWGKPVPGFGDTEARILVIGLAPGAHGSNRTGRMFTGDASGDFLYPALHRTGFANQPISTSIEDGLMLRDIFITAVGRCAPPDNKPIQQELDNCRPFLLCEMEMLNRIEGIVALGHIAFDQILGIFRPQIQANPLPKFSHAAFFPLGDNLPWLLASYHPSRQNTQTGRLTRTMFDQVWITARDLLS